MEHLSLQDAAVKTMEIPLTADQLLGKSSTGHEAAYAVDDSPNTYYQTPDESANDDYMRFLDIDLRGLYGVSGIVLYMLPEGYNHYQIYASETGETYRKIVYKSDDNPCDVQRGDRYFFDEPVAAAYLRINLSYNSLGMQGNLVRLRLFGRRIGAAPASGEKGIHVPDFADTAWKQAFDRFEQDPAWAREKTLRELRDLVGRVLGEAWRDCFEFGFLDAEKDAFRIENGEAGRIVIRGKNGVCMASGLHYYLRYFCKVDYSPLFVSNLRMPDTLPRVPQPIVKESPYAVRYGFHVCAHAYTMAFWEWEQYEACLDWAAMCGVNLMLLMTGQEEIMRRVLTQFGYTDEEVKEYLTGPVCFPWGSRNMSGFGGPLPDNWFADRVELGRRIHNRMQVLGMKPVLRGYFGAVPTDFKEKNPDAQVIPQGEWCRFTRPDVLRPYVEEGCRDMYREVADAFYRAQKAVFGHVTDYFSADPFMEGGRGGDVDQARMFRTIHEEMLSHNPDSIWVTANWCGSIDDRRLAGLTSRKNILVLDLTSERAGSTDLMERNRLPWVWGIVHEFGGKQGLDANTRAVAEGLPNALHSSRCMAGMGMLSEAIGRCPIIYELLWDMAWTDRAPDLKAWGQEYLKRRYGRVSKGLSEAWELLLQSAYACESPDTAESLVNARPTEAYRSTSSWGRGKLTYDPLTLERALALYAEEYDRFSDMECYRYDLVDLARQVLSNSSLTLHGLMMKAYRAGDEKAFEAHSRRFLDLIRLQEDILGTSDQFLTGAWIEEARHMKSARDDWTRDQLEWNARCLITTWGGKRTANEGGLRDYASRSWSGLVGDLCLRRWAKWIDGHITALREGREAQEPDWFLMEWEWANRKSDEAFACPAHAPGEKDLGALVREVLARFTVQRLDPAQEAGTENLLRGKLHCVSGGLTPQDLARLADKRTDTGWVGKQEDWPVVLTCEFPKGGALVTRIGVGLKPLVASGIPVACMVDCFRDGAWTVLYKDDSGNLPGCVSIPCAEQMQKLRFTLNSMGDGELPQLRWVEALGKMLPG